MEQVQKLARHLGVEVSRNISLAALLQSLIVDSLGELGDEELWDIMRKRVPKTALHEEFLTNPDAVDMVAEVEKSCQQDYKGQQNKHEREKHIANQYLQDVAPLRARAVAAKGSIWVTPKGRAPVKAPDGDWAQEEVQAWLP